MMIWKQTPTEVSVRRLLATELDWANACYADANFMPSSRQDFLAVAEVGGNKAGLGRVVPVAADMGELGGMYVLPAFRGQALAGKLVQFLLAESQLPTLFCIPFAHLESFYARYGFGPLPDSLPIPESVAAKFAWCQRHYPTPVRLLVRRNSL